MEISDKATDIILSTLEAELKRTFGLMTAGADKTEKERIRKEIKNQIHQILRLYGQGWWIEVF